MLELFAPLAGHFAAVETAMAAALSDDEPRITGLIADLGRFHGKMLRPALTLLMADACSGATNLHHRLAAAVELIHTATLIHDDLIDDAVQRRNQPTAHVRFGNTTSVLLGDYFYTRAFHLVANLPESLAPLNARHRLMQRLTETTNAVCRGELHQQLTARNQDLSEAEYDRIIYAKTAALCELSSEFGASGGTPTQVACAAAYGRACGMAFQIVDDCLDLSGDAEKIGKTLTTDLERGRMTLPVLRALAATPATERREFFQRIAADIAWGRTEIERRGGIASALDTARIHVRTATDALAAFPSGSARDRLHQLASFITSRDR